MSLASFVAFHNARGATTVGSEDPETGLIKQTLTQLMGTASNRSYVDNPDANYGVILGAEANNPNLSPFTANGSAISWTGTGAKPTVAVVGGGMSGLLTAYQLGKAGFQVTVFEAGQAPDSLVVGGKKVRGAGRIAPIVLSTAESNGANVGSAVAQLGAMRFPSSAYLFWHYMKVTGFSSVSRSFTAFPNVSKVPTTFSGGDALPSQNGVVKGVWGYPQNSDNVKKLPLSPIGFEALNNRHQAAFTSYKPPNSPGNLTLLEITNLVVAGNMSSANKATVRDFWKKTVKQLYKVNYRTFLKTNSYHPAQTFSNTDIARIGTVGFGTGGFGPLFSRCVLDLMRLVVWQYSDEFEVSDLGDYVDKLRASAAAKGVTFRYNTPVYSLFFSRTNKKTYFGLSKTTSGSVTAGGFDYVVLAMSTQAAKDLLSNGRYRISTTLANQVAPNYIFPYYDIRYGSWTSKIKGDLNAMDGMDSVKIFQAINGPASPGAVLTWPKVTPVPSSSRDPRVRACYGAFKTGNTSYQPIGLTYLLPVHPNSTASGAKRPFAASQRVFALHYNWGSNDYGQNLWQNEAAVVKANLIDPDTAVRSSVDSTGKFVGNNSQAPNLKAKLQAAMGQRFLFQQNQNLNSASGNSWNLTSSFNIRNADVRYGIVQWSKVPFINIGFKLDRPNFGVDLIYSSKTTALAVSETGNGMWDGATSSANATVSFRRHESTKNLYFAGCSISNYGGWVEGAFQSALSASAGIVSSAAKTRFGTQWQSKINMTAYDKLIVNMPDRYYLGVGI